MFFVYNNDQSYSNYMQRYVLLRNKREDSDNVIKDQGSIESEVGSDFSDECDRIESEWFWDVAHNNRYIGMLFRKYWNTRWEVVADE